MKVYSKSNVANKKASHNSASGSGRAKPLGIYASTVSTVSTGGFAGKRPSKAEIEAEIQEKQRETRLQRYALQAAAARIMKNKGKNGKDEKVCRCLRCAAPTRCPRCDSFVSGDGICAKCRIPVMRYVDIQYSEETGSSHFKGLEVCGSVWMCAVCAAKITEKKQRQLKRINKKHKKTGGSIYMTTYTIKHNRYDDLQDLLDRFLKARRSAKQGRDGMTIRSRFTIRGTISVLEVTWSPEHGWHPHVHELVYCDLPQMDVEGFEAHMRSSWEHAAAKYGLTMNEHGFDIKRTFGAVEDYIAKFGRPPANKNVWGTESEMTKGHLKKSRSEGGLTPFGILQAITEGHEELIPVFEEYARCFKGRKQMSPTPGLYASYDEVELTDEELAEEPEDTEDKTLVRLEVEQFAVIAANDVIGETLEAGRSGDANQVIAFLAQLGIETKPFEATEHLE